MTTNCKPDDCFGTVGPFTSTGVPIVPEPPTPCPIPVPDPANRLWQLSENGDACFVDGLVNEALGIAGATMNVYKLLGVHEQSKLIDATGVGNPLSNGDLPGFPAKNAFDIYVTEWRSIQKGTNVLASAFIGYDFGEIKVSDNSRDMYSVDAHVRKHITAFSIKQSSSPRNRATKVRLERSEDGKKWYGVGMATLPDNDCVNTVLMKSSVPSRFWRLRPVEFNGTSIVPGSTVDPCINPATGKGIPATSVDYWGVQALQLFDNYLATTQDNIQDKIFAENRDRDYATTPVMLKGSYDLFDVSSELSKFGIELPSQTLTIQISFSSCIQALGRPIVIGDIIEVPSEAQYSAEMKLILKWVEVTDVAWSTQGYTPGWQPTLLSVTAQPAYVSQETQDLFGDLAENEVPNGQGLVDKNDGNSSIFQDYFDFSQTAQAEAKDAVPEKGAEGSSTIREWEATELAASEAQGLPAKILQKIGLNRKGMYVEDAMPPNNASFTEGDAYPPAPIHGAYHRLTYTGLSKDVPARLYRYSTAKGRWIYLESDRRALHNPDKPVLQEFLQSPTRKDNENITKG